MSSWYVGVKIEGVLEHLFCRLRVRLKSHSRARSISKRSRVSFYRYHGIPRIEHFLSFAGNERCFELSRSACPSIVKASGSCAWKMIATCYVINVVAGYIAVCHDSIVFHVERVFLHVFPTFAIYLRLSQFVDRRVIFSKVEAFLLYNIFFKEKKKKKVP